MFASADTENKSTPSDEIHVFSLDADGCIFSQNYINKYIAATKKTELKKDDTLCLETNDLLFKEMASHSKKNAILMVGSNRQSHSMDEFNGKESFFLVLQKIEAHLRSAYQMDVTIDPYLLSDSFSSVAEGATFKGDKSTSFPVDESKLLMLYAQTHHIATKHPGKKIQFHFYDDREDILRPLKSFFEKFPELLPPHVTLHLHKYNGTAEPQKIVSISASEKSALDENYVANLKKLFPNYRDPKWLFGLFKGTHNQNTNILSYRQMDKMIEKFKEDRLKTAAIALQAKQNKTSQTPFTFKTPALGTRKH